MGDSCSKISEPQEDSLNGDERDVHQSRQAESATAKRKRNARASLFRVGSRLNDVPNSPTQRASNYAHVRKAVHVNFEEARTGEGPLGVVGLKNLGNTCFLNSSLQCLSATIPLTDYFLGYNYRSEINKENFLGTGGKLVVAYAELMKQMWLEASDVVKPIAFKAQLEKFAPQFRGYHQHDSQEFLSFLLDGIHEGNAIANTIDKYLSDTRVNRFESNKGKTVY